MTTILFVHGTGVRRAAYEATLAEIRRQVAAWGDIRVQGCLWGEPHGTRLKAGGASIPTFDATRAVGTVGATTGDPEADLWGLLLTDPLATLRLLALVGEGSTKGVQFAAPPSAGLKRSFEDFSRVPVAGLGEPLKGAVGAAGLAEVFDRARQEVARSSAFHDALDAADGPLGDYREALAGAVVAQAVLLDPGSDPEFRLGTDERRRLVALVVDALGGAERRLADRFRGHALAVAGAVACSVGTFGARRYRGKVTEGLAMVIGDILLYQTRGQEIRDAIAGAVRGTDEPVILFAHSLGGVAAVDLLADDPSLYPSVRLLVTAGSQSAFLYEIDALHKVRYPDDPSQGPPLRPDFPRWLNFYDLSDFLSYVGQSPRLFGDRVKDVQVFSRLPFPESHSAYFRDPHVWDTVRGTLE